VVVVARRVVASPNSQPGWELDAEVRIPREDQRALVAKTMLAIDTRSDVTQLGTALVRHLQLHRSDTVEGTSGMGFDGHIGKNRAVTGFLRLIHRPRWHTLDLTVSVFKLDFSIPEVVFSKRAPIVSTLLGQDVIQKMTMRKEVKRKRGNIKDQLWNVPPNLIDSCRGGERAIPGREFPYVPRSTTHPDLNYPAFDRGRLPFTERDLPPSG